MADHCSVIFDFGPLPEADAKRIADASDLKEDVYWSGAGPQLTATPDGWRLCGWGAYGLYGPEGEDTLLALLGYPITVSATMPPDHEGTGERRVYVPDGNGGHTLAKYEIDTDHNIILTAAVLKALSDECPDPVAFRQAVLTAAGLAPGAP